MPNDESKSFILVPLVADFLRKKKPEVVAETGNQLEKNVLALLKKYGFDKHDSFPILEVAWPTIAAALPRFLARPNNWVQNVCTALQDFLDFTGRWDEWLALAREAEGRAVKAKDFLNAGWRAYHAGWIYYLRGQSTEVLACADRAECHWREAKASINEQAAAFTLRGNGYSLTENHSGAIEAYRQALTLRQTEGLENRSVTSGLNWLANAEMNSGDIAAGERDFREALRIAKAIDFREGIATYTGNLAALALTCQDWLGAEAPAREALQLSEKLGRQELIAANCYRLASALVQQGRKPEALPYSRRAVDIYSKLGSPSLASAHVVLLQCET